MYTLTYKILFHFENEETSILEIKLQNQATNDKNKIYHWLLYNKPHHYISRLEFKSMKQENEIQYREFSDGDLVFDETACTYTAGEKIYNMSVINPDNFLPEPLSKAIEDYLIEFNS